MRICVAKECDLGLQHNTNCNCLVLSPGNEYVQNQGAPFNVDPTLLEVE